MRRFQNALAPRSHRLVRSSAALACAAAIAACTAPLAQHPWAAAPAPENVERAQLVLTADDMLPYSTLRDAITRRIPGLRVAREADCAAIGLSAPNPIDPPTAPLVYVDGRPATGTCTLLQLPVFTVQRVEIYSMGGASYPRLPRSPNGMILIYTKRS
jgi:hypothetical protein